MKITNHFDRQNSKGGYAQMVIFIQHFTEWCIGVQLCINFRKRHTPVNIFTILLTFVVTCAPLCVSDECLGWCVANDCSQHNSVRLSVTLQTSSLQLLAFIHKISQVNKDVIGLLVSIKQTYYKRISWLLSAISPKTDQNCALVLLWSGKPSMLICNSIAHFIIHLNYTLLNSTMVTYPSSNVFNLNCRISLTTVTSVRESMWVFW